MTTLTLSLPDDVKEFVDAEVARGGHADANSYVRALIDLQREQADRRELQASLRQELRGPHTVMTSEDWAEIRREGLKLAAERDPS